MPCLSVGWMDPCCSHQGMHELPSFRNSIPEETDALTQMELLLTNPRLRSSPKNFKKNSRHGRNATHPKNRGRFRKWFAWNEGFPFRPPIWNLLIAILHLGESQSELWRDGERDLPNSAACSPPPPPPPQSLSRDLSRFSTKAHTFTCCFTTSWQLLQRDAGFPQGTGLYFPSETSWLC